jgi:hypothetical protein
LFYLRGFASTRSPAARAEKSCEVFHPAMVLRKGGKAAGRT